MKMIFPLMLSVSLLSLFGYATSGGCEPVSQPIPFQASLAESNWNGKIIPQGQQCEKFGGQGSTPRLTVKNIPNETNALIMEYSDKDNTRMDLGGHGKIGYNIQQGTSEVTIPSVPGHSFALPEGFFLVAAHNNPAMHTAGAYLPPCSGGKGHLYYVTIKAVHKPAASEQDAKVLETVQVDLGTY